MTFAVYCLAMYPDIHTRLRKEVLQTMGLERQPTYDDLREMKYLRAFINGESRHTYAERRSADANALQKPCVSIRPCE